MSEAASEARSHAWRHLRRDLMKLHLQRPGCLREYPTLDNTPRPSPVSIALSANAEAIAAQLHEAHGGYVALMVGALPYPPSRDAPPRSPTPELPTLDPAELVVALDGPLEVPSGETVSHAVLVTNTGPAPVRVSISGSLKATIVDGDGAEVGGFVGWQHLSLSTYAIDRQATQRIPLVVGTVSFSVALGYTVPAGDWHLTVALALDERGSYRSTPLPFTVT